MASRTVSILGTAGFFVLAPGTVAGLGPWLISRWRFEGSLGRAPWLAWAGWALIIAGLGALIEAFARFAWRGLGTPAPPLPTERLVVSGAYRFVRNPMYLAVLAIIVGQALWLSAAPMLVYGLLVFLGFHAFVVGYEEPALTRSFGADYAAFRRHVPRWLPRLTPWTGSDETGV